MKYEKGSFITVPSKEFLEGFNPIAQCLYMWLCAFANETGECYPSRSTLALKMGCSEKTVDRMMDILIEIGLVVKENRFKNNEKQTNLYTIQIKSSTPLQSIPTPLQSIQVPPKSRIELNPVLTQSKKTADADFYVEDEKPKIKTPSYEKALKWAEERMGHKFVHRTKQYAAIKRALSVGITGAQLTERWEELESKPFYQDNGLDWTSVVSSFDRK